MYKLIDDLKGVIYECPHLSVLMKVLQNILEERGDQHLRLFDKNSQLILTKCKVEETISEPWMYPWEMDVDDYMAYYGVPDDM